MKGLPDELLYLLVIGGFLLLNYLIQKAARRRQSQAPPAEPPPEAAQENEVPADFWGRTPEIQAASLAPAAPAAPVRRTEAQIAPLGRPRPQRRFSREALMGSRREVQNAIVIAAILGPCRALEPAGDASEAAQTKGAPSRGDRS